METIEKVDRILGKYVGNKPGKLIIAVAAMHGNEKTGIVALRKIFSYLNDAKPDFAGTLVGIAGNLKAIEENCRYFDVDFNRIWFEENAEKVQVVDAEVLSFHEYKELKYLLEAINSERGQQSLNENVVFLDLHNTSSSKGLFSVTFNREEDLKVASAINIPIIVGLEKALRGTAIEYMGKRNVAALAFEGGELGKQSSIDIHEAGIWMVLEASDCIQRNDIPNYKAYKKVLNDAAEDFPKLTELAYVHKIAPQQQFVMEPGFENFQKIEKGQLLAHDRTGPIYAPVSGYILMPLYQKQGEEGFFLTREISL